jgi:hypothetical protein
VYTARIPFPPDMAGSTTCFMIRTFLPCVRMPHNNLVASIASTASPARPLSARQVNAIPHHDQRWAILCHWAGGECQGSWRLNYVMIPPIDEADVAHGAPLPASFRHSVGVIPDHWRNALEKPLASA